MNRNNILFWKCCGQSNNSVVPNNESSSSLECYSNIKPLEYYLNLKESKTHWYFCNRKIRNNKLFICKLLYYDLCSK